MHQETESILLEKKQNWIVAVDVINFKISEWKLLIVFSSKSGTFVLVDLVQRQSSIVLSVVTICLALKCFPRNECGQSIATKAESNKETRIPL